MCRHVKQLGLDAPLVLDHAEDQVDPAVFAALPPAMQREIRLAYMASQRAPTPSVLSKHQQKPFHHVNSPSQHTAALQSPIPTPEIAPGMPQNADAIGAGRAQMVDGSSPPSHHPAESDRRQAWLLTSNSSADRRWSNKKGSGRAAKGADQGIGRFLKQSKV